MYIGFSLLVERLNKQDNTLDSIKIIEKCLKQIGKNGLESKNSKTSCYYAAKNALRNYSFSRSDYSWMDGLSYSLESYLITNYNYPQQKNIEYEDENYKYSLRVILLTNK